MIKKNFLLKTILFLFIFTLIIPPAAGQGELLHINAYDIETPPRINKINQVAKIPVIMYHRVSAHVCNRFEISPSELENDLKYIKENGYKTVFIKDLIEFVYRGHPLPKKTIVLTFDDGNYSDYKYVYPLLKNIR